MILAVALVLGVVAGLAAGGRLEALFHARIRGDGVLLALLILQLALPLVRPFGVLARVAFVVWLASFPVMAATALFNRKQPGMLIICAGLLLNGAVIAANGAMPVSIEAVLAAGGTAAGAAPLPGDYAHVLMNSATRLPWLADVLPSFGPRGVAALLSPGDVTLLAGVAAYVAGAMTRRSKAPGKKAFRSAPQ